MGLLKWLRGGGDNPSSIAAANALAELDANMSPAKRAQIENLETLEQLRDEDGDGTRVTQRGLDLDSGVAQVNVRKK